MFRATVTYRNDTTGLPDRQHWFAETPYAVPTILSHAVAWQGTYGGTVTMSRATDSRFLRPNNLRPVQVGPDMFGQADPRRDAIMHNPATGEWVLNCAPLGFLYPGCTMCDDTGVDLRQDYTVCACQL